MMDPPRSGPALTSGIEDPAAPGPVLRTLANGVRLLALPLPHVRSASVGVFLRVGSRDETPATSGISHVLEHMAFKVRRSARYRRSTWTRSGSGQRPMPYEQGHHRLLRDWAGPPRRAVVRHDGGHRAAQHVPGGGTGA
jgi:hypothetical protein